MAENTYIKGLKEGTEKIYTENGKLRLERTYENGLMEGNAKYYYENGNFTAEYTYVNDKREGDYSLYAADGRLWLSMLYKDDRAVSGIYADGGEFTKTELANWNEVCDIVCHVSPEQ